MIRKIILAFILLFVLTWIIFAHFAKSKLISLINKEFFVAQLLYNVTNSQTGRPLSAAQHGFPTKLSTESVGRLKLLYEQETRA